MRVFSSVRASSLVDDGRLAVVLGEVHERRAAVKIRAGLIFAVQLVSRKIYTVDRLAQLSLLEKLPNSYMWASAMPERCLRRWGFVQKICSDNQIVCHDAIAFNAQYNMSEIETELLEYIFSRYHR